MPDEDVARSFAATADNGADELVVEGDGDAGISILTPATATAMIAFTTVGATNDAPGGRYCS